MMPMLGARRNEQRLDEKGPPLSPYANTCPVCGGRGWVWEPHPNAEWRHQEPCPLRCPPNPTSPP